jgi:hypothetical protein
MSAVNTGRLIKTTGIVTDIVSDSSGVIGQITIDDGTGPAIVYINSYITPNKSLSFVTVGDSISVTGLGSVGENFTSETDFLPRIRVRDRGEIVPVDGFALYIGTESSGGAGRIRTITISGKEAENLEGKYLVVQFTEGTGVNAKVSVVMISSISKTVTVSYPAEGTLVEAWLTSGMPDLTKEDMGVEVYAHAKTIQ